MSGLWSTIVIVLVLANILACLWLLVWTSKKRPNEAQEGAETGHVWDGDLREYNNPLPRWWLNLFVITVFFGLGYLVLYPGLGNLPGVLGWTEHQQHDERLAVVEERRDALYSTFAGKSIEALMGEHEALEQGGKLFTLNCAGCHGTDAHGAIGFPNLTDGDWLYGGSPDQVFTTITNGRNGAMPALGATMDAATVDNLVAMLQDWESAHANPASFEPAITKFNTMCMACHGMDGKGNPMLGAPNLTDDVWLYGNAPDALKTTLMQGRNGAMPSFKDQLDETQRKLLAAWVLSQGGSSGQ